MTVSAGSTKTTQACNGSLTDFDFNFAIYKEEDIAVIIKHIATEVETVLVLSTDYTVASDDFASGGTVSTIKEIDAEMVPYAWSTDYSITIMLNLALTQETDLLYGGSFSSEAIELTVDRLTRIAQQLNEKINRTLKLRKTSALNNIEIDDLEAGKFVIVNAAGDALEMGTVAGEPGQPSVSNNPYNKDTWNGITDIAASKNAIRDELFNNRFTKGSTYAMILALSSGDFGTLPISNDAYGASWENQFNITPSQNVLFDKFETIGTGDGDVKGPDTNIIEYVPQWLTTNSKELKNGFPITTLGKTLLANTTAAAMRSILGLSSAALRTAEDTMTDGANLPDGHAIKTYGDANWSGGTGDVVGPESAVNNAIPLYDGVTGKLLQDSTRLIEDALTDGANLPDGHAIKTYGDANWGTGKANLTEFLEQTAWRLFYSNTDGDVVELALGTSGQYLKANGVSAVPTWDVPAGAGDVVGPATHAADYVPQWNGTPNSKTLIGGFAITAAGKAILDDIDAATQRTTLGLGSAATRNAEDTMTNGANLPDGAAIKVYGDANWGAGSSKWTDGGTYIYGTAEAGNIRLHDSGQLEVGATGGTSAPLISANKWGFSSDVVEDARRLLILDGTEDETLTPAMWLEKLYNSNATPSGDPTIPVCLYAAHKHSGSGAGFTHTIMAYALNEGTGNNDVIAISGRARKKGSGVGDACGIWGSAYNDVNQNGGVMGLEASIYQNIAGMTAEDRLNTKWSCALHVMGSSIGSPAKAGIAVDATNTYRFWNAMIIDKDCFGGAGTVGTVGINMGSCDSGQNPQHAIRFGIAGTHLYCNSGNLKFYDPITGNKTLAQLASGGGSGDVVGPASHSASYVPQWNNTPNSKTLIEGFFVTALGKNLLNDATTAAMRSTLALGSAAQRNSEDTMSDGANLPDGHAIKTYGDANWGGGSGNPGGSNSHIQFNNSGVFGGDAAFVWDNSKKSVIMSKTMSITGSYTARYGSYANITLSGTQGTGNTQISDWRRMHAPAGKKAWMTGYWIDLFPKVEQVSSDYNKYDVNGFMVINNGNVKAQAGLYVGGLAGGDVPTSSGNPRGYPWTCGVEIGVGATFGITFAPAGMNYPSGYEYDIGIDLASYWTGSHPRYYITPILLPNKGHIKSLDSYGSVKHLIGLDETNTLNIGVQTPSGINLGWDAGISNPICIRVGGMNSKYVEVGATNSGGTGYRTLRVLN